MEPYRITAGFSEIMSEYEAGWPVHRPRQTLHMIFSFIDNELTVHERGLSKMKMILAIYNPLRNLWETKFKKNSHGYDVIEFGIKTNRELGRKYFEISKTMKELYQLNGFSSFY